MNSYSIRDFIPMLLPRCPYSYHAVLVFQPCAESCDRRQQPGPQQGPQGPPPPQQQEARQRQRGRGGTRRRRREEEREQEWAGEWAAASAASRNIVRPGWRDSYPSARPWMDPLVECCG